MHHLFSHFNTAMSSMFVKRGNLKSSQKLSEEETKKKKLLDVVVQLYMNKDEVVKTLLNCARMAPGLTILDLIISGDRSSQLETTFNVRPLCSIKHCF
ncbi:hypothetical protein Tco_0573627 [Tanacetum coccineum]